MGVMRSIMINAWMFDFAKYKHWKYIWNLWVHGWIIDEPTEWCFIITIFMFIPIWLTLWTAVCSVPWGSWFMLIVCFPFELAQKKKKEPPPLPKMKGKKKGKKDKKKERPPAMRTRSKDEDEEDEEDEEEDIDEEDDDFSDLMDADDEEDDDDEEEDYEAPPVKKKKKKAKTKKAAPTSNEVDEIIESAGYELISNVTIKGCKIDFVAISEDDIALCLVDDKEGDWLADEERFNDEEPLWFSESNHRVSPVRQVLDAKEILEETLSDMKENIDVNAVVVIKQGAVINAEDMLDIWSDLDVTVARTANGKPEELQKFASILPDNNDNDVPDRVIEFVRKAINDS